MCLSLIHTVFGTVILDLHFSRTLFICTAFTIPLAVQSLLSLISWKWAYGAFAIIMPFVFVLLAFVFKFYQKSSQDGYYKKGRKHGLCNLLFTIFMSLTTLVLFF